MRTLIAVIAAVLLTLPTAGCGRDADTASALPDAAERRSSAIPVREVARSRDDSLFAQISAVAPDSRGFIYVGDWQTGRIAVLDSTGALVRTFGRKGLGPGEFRGVRSIQVLPGDSLLVYDAAAVRVSVFPPGSPRPAYVRNVAGSVGGVDPHLIDRIPGTDAFVAISRPPFTSDATSARYDQVRVLGPDGKARGEPLRVFPSKSFVRVQQGRSFSLMPNPFGREGFMAVGAGGRIHLAWGDSLSVQILELSGRQVGGFVIPFQGGPVAREFVDEAVSGFPPQMANLLRPALEDSVPARWPAIRALQVDDQGRIWVLLGGPVADLAEWASFSPDGRYLGSIFLPRDVEVEAVRRGRVYAFQRDDLDVPHVVVYQLAAPPARGNG